MAKYIATSVGWTGVQLVQPGDVFDAPADFPKGEWFKPYKGKDKPAEAASEQQQEAQPGDGATTG